MSSSASSITVAGADAGSRDSGSGGWNKEGLGWLEWGRGWLHIVGEFFFQRIAASHLENPSTIPHLDGITCIVTGSTSGIGLQISRQLAEAGAHVVMAVRKIQSAHELIQKWQNEQVTGLPINVEVMELDLLSLDSVVQFAKIWNARQIPLHALINNAGIFALGEPQRFTKDGHEEHMQVNHLAPALLSMLLIPSLLKGSPSRIINVNSIMHSIGFVDPDDMNVTSGKRKYTSLLGYSNSKLAQIKFSSILQKRIPAEAGINVVCASPGIVHTNVTRDLPKFVVAAYHFIPYFIFDAQEGYLFICPLSVIKISTERKPIDCFQITGSRSTLFAATDPQVPDYCGMLKADEWPVCAYISHDCRPANASEEAHNLKTSQAVWEKTLEMINLPSDALEKLLEGQNVNFH